MAVTTLLDLSHADPEPTSVHVSGMRFRNNETTIRTRGIRPFQTETARITALANLDIPVLFYNSN